MQTKDPVVAVDRRILTEIAEHSEQMENLRYLTDEIGPRLTGTENLKRANDWTAERFRAYGLSNVHQECYAIPHSWRRGTVRADVVAPSIQRLPAEAAGWSPNTSGTVRGPVVYVKAEKMEDLLPYKGKLQGAIVITTSPNDRERVEDRPLLPRASHPEVPLRERRKFWLERDNFFKNQSVLGVLRDSDKNFGLFGPRCVA